MRLLLRLPALSRSPRRPRSGGTHPDAAPTAPLLVMARAPLAPSVETVRQAPVSVDRVGSAYTLLSPTVQVVADGGALDFSSSGNSGLLALVT